MHSKKVYSRLLGAVASLAIITALSYLIFPGGVAKADQEGGQTLRLGIDTTDSEFSPDTLNANGDANFYIDGEIVDPDTHEHMGFFRCWGQVRFEDEGFAFTVVSQEYRIDGRGAIQVQGLELGAESIAVIGGTGDFRNARGEGVFGDFELGFSMEFHLIGARP